MLGANGCKAFAARQDAEAERPLGRNRGGNRRVHGPGRQNTARANRPRPPEVDACGPCGPEHLNSTASRLGWDAPSTRSATPPATLPRPLQTAETMPDMNEPKNALP